MWKKKNEKKKAVKETKKKETESVEEIVPTPEEEETETEEEEEQEEVQEDKVWKVAEIPIKKQSVIYNSKEDKVYDLLSAVVEILNRTEED